MKQISDGVYYIYGIGWFGPYVRWTVHYSVWHDPRNGNGGSLLYLVGDKFYTFEEFSNWMDSLGNL